MLWMGSVQTGTAAVDWTWKIRIHAATTKKKILNNSGFHGDGNAIPALASLSIRPPCVGGRMLCDARFTHGELPGSEPGSNRNVGNSDG
jgi:hypothetical protein